MAQHDYSISDASGGAFLSDLNNALAAIVTNNSGPAAPSVTYPYMPWSDTTAGLWKVRNAANSGWVVVGTLDAPNLGLAPLASPAFTGTPAAQTAAAGTSTTQLATTAFVASCAMPVRSTSQTASGTSVDFTGIPNWVKRVTVMLDGVSTSGASNVLVQLGDSGGIEATGYTATAYGQTNVVTTSTAGFVLNCTTVAAADLRSGVLTIPNIASNTWIASGTVSPVSGQLAVCSGIKALSSTLDRLRVTTANGTDTFDAGTINILYE